MNELKELVKTFKGNVVRLSIAVKEHNIHFPNVNHIEDIYEWILMVQGFVDCLEKYNLIKEQ